MSEDLQMQEGVGVSELEARMLAHKEMYILESDQGKEREPIEESIRRYIGANAEIAESLLPVVEKELSEKYPNFQNIFLLLPHIPEHERTRIIERGLLDKDFNTKHWAASSISFAPEEQRPVLRALLLRQVQQEERSWNGARRGAASDLVQFCGEHISPGLVERYLKSKQIKMMRNGLENIPALSDAHQRKYLAWAISYLKKQLQEKRPEDAMRIINHIWLVRNIPESPEKEELIAYLENNFERIFKSDIIRVRARSVLQEQEARKPMPIPSEAITGDPIDVSDALEHMYEGLNEGFIRAAQRTQNTATPENARNILLGKEYFSSPESSRKLKGQAMMRQIDPEKYLAWKTAYESEVWAEEGFDYVPIEPIIAPYEFNAQDLKTPIRVFSRVIPALTFQRYSERVQDQALLANLDFQMEKIITVLNKRIGVTHRHAHDANFCILPRMKDGKIDWSRPGRVYLIDFSLAWYAPVERYEDEKQWRSKGSQQS